MASLNSSDNRKMENTDYEVDSQYPAMEESQTQKSSSSLAQLRSILFSSSSSDSQSEDPSSPYHSTNQSFESSDDEEHSTTVLITRYQLNPYYKEVTTSSPQRSIDDNGLVIEKELLPSSAAALQFLSPPGNLTSPGNTTQAFKSSCSNPPQALITPGNSPLANKSPNDLPQALKFSGDIPQANKYPENVPQTFTSSINSSISSKSPGNSPGVSKSPDRSLRVSTSLAGSPNAFESSVNSTEAVRFPGDSANAFKSRRTNSQNYTSSGNSPRVFDIPANTSPVLKSPPSIQPGPNLVDETPPANKSPNDLPQALKFSGDIPQASKYPENIPQTFTSSINSSISSKSPGNSPGVFKSPNRSLRVSTSLVDSPNAFESSVNSTEAVRFPGNSANAFKSPRNNSQNYTSSGNSPRVFEKSANTSPVSKSPPSIQPGPNLVDETPPVLAGHGHSGQLMSSDYPSQIPNLSDENTPTLLSPHNLLSSAHSSPKTHFFNNSPHNLTSLVLPSKIPSQSYPLSTSQLSDGTTPSSTVFSTPPRVSPKRNVSPSSATSSHTSDSSSDSSSECNTSPISSGDSPLTYSSPGSSASPSFIQDDSLLTYLLDNEDTSVNSPVSTPRPLTIPGCLPLLASPQNSSSCNLGNTPKSTVSTIEINSSPVHSRLSPVNFPLSPVHSPLSPVQSSLSPSQSAQWPPTGGSDLLNLEGEMQISPSTAGIQTLLFPPASTSVTKSKRKFWEHEIDQVKRQKTENETFKLIGIEVEYIKQNDKSRKDLTQIGCAVLSVDKNGIIYPSEETFFRVIEPPGMTEYLSMKMKGDLLKSLHIQQNESGQFEFRNEFEIIDNDSNKIKCISEDEALEEVFRFIVKFNSFVLVSLDEAIIRLILTKLREASDQHIEPFLVNNRCTFWSQVLNNLNASSEDIAMDFEDWFVKNMNPEDNKIPQHPNALDISSMLIKAIKHIVEIKIKSGYNFYDILARIIHSDIISLNSSPKTSASEDKLKFLEIFNSLRPHLTPTIFLESVDVIDLSSESDNGQDQTSTISSLLTNAQQEKADNSNIVWSPSQGSFNFSGIPGRQATPWPSGHYTRGYVPLRLNGTNPIIQASSSNHQANSQDLSNCIHGPSSHQDEGLLPTPFYPQQNLVQITISNERAWISPNQSFVASQQPTTTVCFTPRVNQDQGPVSEAGSRERNSQNEINHHVTNQIGPLVQTRSGRRKDQSSVLENGSSLNLHTKSNQCRNINKVCLNMKKGACSFQMCRICCRKEKKNELCSGHLG